MRDKDFEKTKSLAHDGITNDADTKPGLAKEWYDWLLRTAVAEKDKPHVIEYARYLFVDGFRNDQDYYQILKKNTDTAQPAAGDPLRDHHSTCVGRGRVILRMDYQHRDTDLPKGKGLVNSEVRDIHIKQDAFRSCRYGQRREIYV